MSRLAGFALQPDILSGCLGIRNAKPERLSTSAPRQPANRHFSLFAIPRFRGSIGSTSHGNNPQAVIVLDQEYVKKRPRGPARRPARGLSSVGMLCAVCFRETNALSPARDSNCTNLETTKLMPKLQDPETPSRPRTTPDATGTPGPS